MLLQLMYIVLVQVMIRADTAFMVKLETATTSGIDEQIANLVSIIVFFLMGAGVAVLIPGVAAYLGGGVPLSPSALTRLPGNIASAVSRAMRPPATPPKPAG